LHQVGNLQSDRHREASGSDLPDGLPGITLRRRKRRLYPCSEK
jgi:hypothetical protein